ncbi:17-beta-hydroxysteroid dehydrogenase 14 isoform X2 [Aplysia californica]|uniref:17-beta-hydroxysteroid dehydrogenase 14 isoform X2 n=1 Tax=Aplysia californica TaxID=6500 RepID=A0ABM1VUX5_APLCA|nr:17-beta-hydroxysteroid dehydrogenase 14 isoform X2 [Aplysia californica]
MASAMLAANSQRYQGKVTIVTGGSAGIGFGVVSVFEDEGKAKAVELNAKGPGECIFFCCDMTVESQIKDLIGFTVSQYGQIDCVVNNAGAHPPHKPIDDFSAEDLENLHRLNVTGYYLMSKYSLPHLRKTQGNIINNCSLVAQISQREAVPYVTTKGAVLSMTKALALDEAENNVRVNSFSPGNVLTPMWEQAAIASGNYDEAIEIGRNEQPMGRYGTIEECGLLCLFLATDATFCTGININITGGAELGYGRKTRKE